MSTMTRSLLIQTKGVPTNSISSDVHNHSNGHITSPSPTISSPSTSSASRTLLTSPISLIQSTIPVVFGWLFTMISTIISYIFAIPIFIFIWILCIVRTIVTTLLLTTAILHAFVATIIGSISFNIFNLSINKLKSCWHIVRHFIYPYPHCSIHSHVRAQGYELQNCRVVTKDGFILSLHRIRVIDKTKEIQQNGDIHNKVNGQNGKCTHFVVPTKGPILLQHGLFNTSVTFVLNECGKSLAFYLADLGYDIYLGNTRGNVHSRAHIKHSSLHTKFWDWSLDELTYDIEAIYQYILTHAVFPDQQDKKIVYIGHSQGCIVGLQAFSTVPAVRDATKLFIMLAPAVFINPLEGTWLKLITLLYRISPQLYYFCIGESGFLPIMEYARHIVPQSLWRLAGELMFDHLFGWSAQLWEQQFVSLYFQETPSIGSAKKVAHWLQSSISGEFRKYDYGNKHDNLKHYGTEVPPDYDLSQVDIPIAIFHGGRDRLINIKKLVKSLPNIIFMKEIPDYYHLDCQNAADAHIQVFGDLQNCMVNVQNMKCIYPYTKHSHTEHTNGHVNGNTNGNTNGNGINGSQGTKNHQHRD